MTVAGNCPAILSRRCLLRDDLMRGSAQEQVLLQAVSQKYIYCVILSLTDWRHGLIWHEVTEHVQHQTARSQLQP